MKTFKECVFKLVVSFMIFMGFSAIYALVELVEVYV
mgnify:CR=1 FL=1